MGYGMASRCVWALTALAVCGSIATCSGRPTDGETLQAKALGQSAKFSEDASGRHVDSDGKSFAMSIADIDDDGDLDIFLTNSGSADVL